MLRHFSAGGVVFKNMGGQVLFLIRKASSSPGYRGVVGWSLPKGGIEKGENSQEAALREVAEETGIAAEIVSKLTEVRYFFMDQEKQKVFKTVVFFLMKWKSDLSQGFDHETEEIRWVEMNEARELLVYKNEVKIVEKAKEQISGLS
jgi:8-oxo-dGTP pyrophosphatase MutT (NUDIX family)